MEALGIEGAWVFTPQVHTDSRGAFLEAYRGADFAAALGYRLAVGQVNCSVSRRWWPTSGLYCAATAPFEGPARRTGHNWSNSAPPRQHWSCSVESTSRGRAPSSRSNGCAEPSVHCRSNAVSRTRSRRR